MDEFADIVAVMDKAACVLAAKGADLLANRLQAAATMLSMRAADAGVVDEWRPIETCREHADHPMRTVLLYWPGLGVSEGYYFVDEEFEDRPAEWRSPESGWLAMGDQCVPIEQPTHWRPKPQPPALAAAQGNSNG